MTRTVSHLWIVLLLFSSVVLAESAQHRVTHLNNPGTAFQVPPPKTTQDVQKMLETRRTDIEFILREKGWHGSFDDLVLAVKSGKVTETSISPGAELPFLAYRRHGRPVYLDNVIWSGKAPFGAFVVQFDSNGYTTRFYVPKPCGNFWFEERAAEQKPVAVTTTSVSVEDVEVCVTQTPVLKLAVQNAPSGSSVQVAVDGATVLTIPATNGSLEKDLPAYPLGPHTITATLANASDTASLTVKPCPPICSLSVVGSPAKQGDKYSIDVSGSQVAPGVSGAIRTAHVVVQVDGNDEENLDLTAPNLRSDELKAHKAGTYSIHATVTDEAGQTSTNDCSAGFDVAPGKSAFFIGVFGGKERFIRDEFPDGRCAPLLGVKVGVLPRLGEHAEAELSVGGKLNIRDTDNSSVFVDAALNALVGRGFIGGGVSFWDLTLSDTRAAALLVQFGFNLSDSGKYQFAVEGRSPFNELDNLDNNYQFWAGFRFRLGH